MSEVTMLSVGDNTDVEVAMTFETEVNSMMEPIYSCKLVKHGKKRSPLSSENLPLMLTRCVQNAVESPNSCLPRHVNHICGKYVSYNLLLTDNTASTHFRCKVTKRLSRVRGRCEDFIMFS